MKHNFDIVVIGSGLGGLVSALIMAKEGFRVAVLEKNVQFGGNLQTFSRNKCIFDTGVHYLGGLAEGDNLHGYFDYLGINSELKLEKMDEVFDKIIFNKDETEYPIAQGFHHFKKHLLKVFPDEKKVIKQYLEDLQTACAAFPYYVPGKQENFGEQALFINAKKYFTELTENKTLRAVLAGQSFLYGGIGDETPFYVHALCVNSYIKSAWKCKNGGSRITKILMRKLKEHGAVFFKRTEIFSFNFNNNCLISVSAKNGKEFFADRFISNIDIKATLNLAGEQNFKKVLVNRVKNLEPNKSCFSVYMVLKPDQIKYFNHNFYHFKNPDSAFENDEDFYMLSATESSANPGFAESVTVLVYMNFDEVKAWEDTLNTVANPHERGKKYEQFKHEKTVGILKLISKKFPEIPFAAKHIYTSSPLSYRDYIGCENGSLYGYKHFSDNPLRTVFSPKTKVPNLFLTGQSVNMHGILGVTIGAFATCREMLGRNIIQKKNDENL